MGNLNYANARERLIRVTLGGDFPVVMHEIHYALTNDNAGKDYATWRSEKIAQGFNEPAIEAIEAWADSIPEELFDKLVESYRLVTECEAISLWDIGEAEIPDFLKEAYGKAIEKSQKKEILAKMQSLESDLRLLRQQYESM